MQGVMTAKPFDDVSFLEVPVYAFILNALASGSKARDSLWLLAYLRGNSGLIWRMDAIG